MDSTAFPFTVHTGRFSTLSGIFYEAITMKTLDYDQRIKTHYYPVTFKSKQSSNV